MLGFMETELFIALVAMVCIMSYFVGTFMDSLLEGDGFGTLGNMMLLIAGTLLGFYFCDNYVYGTNPVNFALVGISGGFLCLAVFSLSKAVLNRFGF